MAGLWPVKLEAEGREWDDSVLFIHDQVTDAENVWVMKKEARWVEMLVDIMLAIEHRQLKSGLEAGIFDDELVAMVERMDTLQRDGFAESSGTY
jgi:hypothetical protein